MHPKRITKKHPSPCNECNQSQQPIHFSMCKHVPLKNFKYFEGKYVNLLTSQSYSYNIPFKLLNLLFQFRIFLPTHFLGMSYFYIVEIGILLLILLRGQRLLGLQFSFMVETSLFPTKNINMSSFLKILLTLSLEKVSLMFTTKLPFIK